MSDFNPPTDWHREIIEPDQRPLGMVILSKVPRGAKIASSRSLSLAEIVAFVKAASSLVFLIKIPDRFRFYVLEF